MRYNRIVEKPFRIAVLASTHGTDLQAIIDEMKAGKMPGIELTCVLSNKKDCYALERAKEQNYETYFVNPLFPDGTQKPREAFDEKIAKILESKYIDLVVLIGYMRILSPFFIRRFKNRIINVHPALLPKFGGKNFFGNNIHEEVLKTGEKETGMTIHLVDEGVDTGKILLQKKVPIEPSDTPKTLKEKVQRLEKTWYPEVIRWFAQGKITS